MNPKQCPSCGSKNNPEFTICWQCKNSFDLPVDPAKIEQYRKEKKDKRWRILVYLVAIEQFWRGLVKIIAAWGYFTNYDNARADVEGKRLLFGLSPRIMFTLFILVGIYAMVCSIGLARFKKWGYWGIWASITFVFVIAAESFVRALSHNSNFDMTLFSSNLFAFFVLIYSRHLFKDVEGKRYIRI